ncbi:MAG: DUF4388 domain-containing protein [Myxococcota bacterium]
MSTRPSILIADPDVEEVRALKEALGTEYEIFVARDGSKALELSILKYPDLILFYRRCPLISAMQFLRILRSNPRTEEVPLIVISDERLAAATTPSFLEGVLVKPLNLDEVRAHVASVLRRRDTARKVGVEQGAVSGSLDQISMPDLLQIFSVNRRTGSLQLTEGPAAQAAEVFLHEGRIVEAASGPARGEKALYRIVGWDRGRFVFLPDRRAPSVSISASTDGLLMEGLRQHDELNRLAPELPDRQALIERRVPTAGLPEGLHPVTAEIVGLLEFYPRVGDLVDRARATDLEVHLALRSLMQAGLVQVAVPPVASAPLALLTQEEGFDLQTRLRRCGLAPTYQQRPKVAVLAAEPDDLRALALAFAGLRGFRVGNLEELHRYQLGSLGELVLDGGLRVELYAVSPDEHMLPMVTGLSGGTVAAVVLSSSKLESSRAVVQMLAERRRASIVVVRRPGESVPTQDFAEGQTTLELPALDEPSARVLMGALLRQMGSRDLRGVSL